MTDNEYSPVVEVARSYYNSPDADTFYTTVWGGEDLHLGIYESSTDTIFRASRRTVDRMAELSRELKPGARVLDLGAGFGGSARHLAGQYGCHVVCLNLSEVENQRNREMNERAGLGERITVVDGSYQSLPFEADVFDVVWSQDAILHSDDRAQVLREANRVLRSGGQLVFTDPMQSDDCPAGVLDPVLERIHLGSLGSPAFYQAMARELGMEATRVEDQSQNLIRHYAAVLRETERQESLLRDRGVSQEYLANMKAGLARWVDGGQRGWLAWAIFVFTKP
jgi:ubiquinone/menaquinone biosynthesis C-methylase UbiE